MEVLKWKLFSTGKVKMSHTFWISMRTEGLPQPLPERLVLELLLVRLPEVEVRDLHGQPEVVFT